MRVSIVGPILSVEDMAPHRAFFEEALGLISGVGAGFGNDVAERLTGVSDQIFETVLLHTDGTDYGVRLWRFTPGKGEVLRDPSHGTDRDAPKVIDFYTPDFEDALARLKSAGFEPKDAIADYDTPNGRFLEAHFWRPDGIVVAMISGDRKFFEDFATIRDQPFSEPQSISSPVSDASAARAFYKDLFGLGVVYEYTVEDPTFDALVGGGDAIALRAWNVGLSTKTPYLGLIDYGLAGKSGKSLLGKSRPPARGLLGVEMLVSDAGAVAGGVADAGGELIAGPTRAMIAPYGECISLLVAGPHGVLHHVLEVC